MPQKDSCLPMIGDEKLNNTRECVPMNMYYEEEKVER